jgi:succinate dehydrogenase flavin-adding protein (antitoxin of CptAB toxin-antitoxin module)
MSELDRVKWHCRRGLLELDIVLEKFNHRHLERLAPDELKRYEELLEYPDNDLLDLVMGRAELREDRYAGLLAMLRAA